MSEWINYYEDKDAKRPTSGYIEYTHTWDGEKGLHYMKIDENSNELELNIIWSRGAPIVIKKYRYITKEYYFAQTFPRLCERIIKNHNALAKDIEELKKVRDTLF